MALTLIDTPKLATSNAYCDETDGDTYHEKIPSTYTGTWTSATTAIKEAALVWATTLLDDLFEWKGYPTDRGTPQALRWPRTGVVNRDGITVNADTIPAFLREACAEWARHLIDANLTAQKDGEGLVEGQIGGLAAIFDKNDPRPTIPDSVIAKVKWYAKEIRDPKRVHSIKMVR